MTVVLLNPLGAGLAHYTTSLEHVLLSCDTPTERIDIAEPSSADYGKVHWLLAYVDNARRSLKGSRPQAILATWATLGYLDLPILSVIGRSTPAYVVMHDPRPLVYARGYGSTARKLARQRVVKGKLMVHSAAAAQAILEDADVKPVLNVPHPMLAPRLARHRPADRKIIRVLGQYKPDRDIDAMRQLARDAPSSWRLEIIGRNWPGIEGWEVTPDFVEESAFAHLIEESDAVLIPYTRFFQSGVAIRALEAGIPPVGPRDSSLAELLGEDCPWLVRGGAWAQSVASAIDTPPEDVHSKAQGVYAEVISRWTHMLDREDLRSSSKRAQGALENV
jgi:hypothetical protein